MQKAWYTNECVPCLVFILSLDNFVDEVLHKSRLPLYWINLKSAHDNDCHDNEDNR